MQLQIECNSISPQHQSCLICNKLFETAEARIVLCDDRGNDHGEVCPTCLKNGFYWLNHQFEQLKRYKSRPKVQKNQQLKVPVSV